jgi:basic amino acid/polyamine antiporter, APA family
VFRRREPHSDSAARFRTPGHPWTTILFVAAFWLVALNTVVQFPTSAGIGVLVLVAGVPVYVWWSRRRVRLAARSSAAPPSFPSA